MQEEKSWELLINIRWPHEGFSIGYDIIPYNEEEPYYSVLLYLGLVTLIINWD